MIRRLLVAAILLMPATAFSQGAVTLVDVDISAAVADQLSPIMPLARLAQESQKYVLAQAAFTYQAGGTDVTAYVQTSLDGGTTWIDIMAFNFTTATATKISKVSLPIALAAAATPTDGSLTDDTILDGVIGDRVRVKYTTTGTYTGISATGTIDYVDGTPITAKDVATGTIDYVDATPITAGKVAVLGTATYTFVASGLVAVAGDVDVGASADAGATNLANAIMNTGGTPGVGNDYMPFGGAANDAASATINTGTDQLALTALTPGVGGNTIALTSDEASFTPSGATLTGGAAGTVAVLGTATYTFMAAGLVAVAGDVDVGANADATMTNLQRAIMNVGGTPGVGNDYMPFGGVANDAASAAINTGTDQLALTALTPGSAGNAIALTSDEASFTLSGAALAGGADTLPNLKINALIR